MIEFSPVDQTKLPTESEQRVMEYLLSKNQAHYPYFEREDFRLKSSFVDGVGYWLFSHSTGQQEANEATLHNYHLGTFDLSYFDLDREEVTLALLLDSSNHPMGFAYWRLDGREVRRTPQMKDISPIARLEFE